VTPAQKAALQFLLELVIRQDLKISSAYVDVQTSITDRARELMAALEAE
jgi:hypothetical protein